MMTEVFITYSREDKDFVLQLRDDLQCFGIGVWMDIYEIEGGENWAREISRSILDRRVVVVVLSPHAVHSVWVNKEIAFAIQMRKIIIPVMYRECFLPISVADLHYIDFSLDYEEGIKQLLISCRSYGLVTESDNPNAFS